MVDNDNMITGIGENISLIAFEIAAHYPEQHLVTHDL